jgi:putative endonuclease
MNSGNFYIYSIVSLKDQRIYVGISQDVTKRIKEHNSGKVISTKAFIPWRLFYSEYVGSSSSARVRERYFKSGGGKRRLKKILELVNPGSLPD